MFSATTHVNLCHYLVRLNPHQVVVFWLEISKKRKTILFLIFRFHVQLAKTSVSCIISDVLEELPGNLAVAVLSILLLFSLHIVFANPLNSHFKQQDMRFLDRNKTLWLRWSEDIQNCYSLCLTKCSLKSMALIWTIDSSLKKTSQHSFCSHLLLLCF